MGGYIETDLTPAQLIGRRTVIAGEVNTGKTTLTARLLAGLAGLGLEPRLLVWDLAPVIPTGPDLRPGIGGRLALPESRDILCLRPGPVPPRLTAGPDAALAVELARANSDLLRRSLARWDPAVRDVVVINDVTLFLQGASAAELIGLIEPASTVIANGYHGTSLAAEGAADPLSAHERREMEQLTDWAEVVIGAEG